MWVAKQCKCGSNEFEQETDDDVFRCAECGRLAKIILCSSTYDEYDEYEKSEE